MQILTSGAQRGLAGERAGGARPGGEEKWVYDRGLGWLGQRRRAAAWHRELYQREELEKVGEKWASDEHRPGRWGPGTSLGGHLARGQERTREDKRGQERTREDKRGQERTREDKRGQERSREDKRGQERSREDKRGQESMVAP